MLPLKYPSLASRILSFIPSSICPWRILPSTYCSNLCFFIKVALSVKYSSASTAAPCWRFTNTQDLFSFMQTKASLYISLPTDAHLSVHSSVARLKLKLSIPYLAFFGNCGQYHDGHSDFHLTFILDTSLKFTTILQKNPQGLVYDLSGKVFPVHPLGYNSCSDSLS